MDRSLKQKINKATEILNDTIVQLDLLYIFRTLHGKKVEYTFFQLYMKYSLGLTIYRAQNNPQKFKSIIIISSIFSDHKVMKLEIKHRKKKLKKKKQTNNNYMETKQHATKKANGSMVNQRRNLKIP